MTFEWDDGKAASNQRKHGVSFEEAKTVFKDPDLLIKPDELHSVDEDRAQIIGVSERGRILFVVTVERYGDTTRIISARKATRREAQDYVESAGRG